MAEVTAAAVKALRDATDMPMMMCKQALQEAEGDAEKATQILMDKAGKRLEKRTENATEEGRIFIDTCDKSGCATMVEIQCESAPVASGANLADFGKLLVTQMLTGPGAATADELLAQSTADGRKLLDIFTALSSKIQEKIVVNRVVRADAPVGLYVHHDGKTAAMFQATGDGKKTDILRDVAMHVAAMKPTVTNVEEADPALVKAERDRLSAEARATGKPENIIDKIVDGRMKLYYRDEAGVLAEQAFAKDDSKSVEQVLAECGFKAKSFTLWTLGK